jgi:hypothetical protein
MYLNTRLVRVFELCHQEGCETGRGAVNGGKIKWKLFEIDTRV